MIEARDGAGAPPHDAAADKANGMPDAGGDFQSGAIAAEGGAGDPAGGDMQGRIREKARELWILEGRPNEDGHEQRHWDMARQLILQDQYIPMDARFEAHTRPADIGKHS